ncbi:precorrin-6A/cobalt-precorrin-6A reductase, partial [uncultured Deinococcus sp.]|uniref:precorrin-6A/cobalt-precorrin-6A reductase n=1 Tax=uncultured Deinococcus sp. TaxID=158789 RepID=UPI002588F973
AGHDLGLRGHAHEHFGVGRGLPEGGEVLARVLELGVPPQNVSAMVGPFSHEFNVAQWRAWSVGAVVTKDSGAQGGLPAKLSAARELGVPLIVVRRPDAVPGAFSSPEALIGSLKELP